MRVLIVDHKDIFGGGQVALLNVMRAWAKQGADVQPALVCSPNAALLERADAEKFAHVSFPLGAIVKTRGVVWNLVQRIVPTIRLWRTIRQTRAQVILANGAYSLLACLWAAKLARVPVVWWEHNTTLPDNDFTRQLIRWANQIVVVSEPIRAQFLELDPRAAQKISVIANGVDTELFRANADTRLKLRRALGMESAWVVGTVSRLSSEKGIDIFVRAANELVREFANARFLIVGDGPEMGPLRTCVTSDAIQFPGAQNDVASWLNSFDLFVMPSRAEAFGIAVIEAMACELPVVGTNVGGLSQVILDGETGLLVPPEDAAALASAISRLMAQPSQCRLMGAQGRARVEKFFSIERAARNMLTVLEKSH